MARMTRSEGRHGRRRGRRAGARLLTVLLLAGAGGPAAAQEWTLSEAVSRAVAVAPAVGEAEGTVQRRVGELDAAGRWPNPRAEVTVGDEVGQELGDDDWRVQELAVSQPLPVGGRIGERRAAAEAALDAARAGRAATVLAVERRAAAAFHRLQAAQRAVAQAEQHLERARGFERIAERRAAVGDISGRARQRIRVLAAEAEAARQDARREARAARQRLITLLQLPADAEPQLPPLTEPAAPPAPEVADAAARSHPELDAARARAEAAERRVAQAEAARIPDLELRLGREAFALGGERESAYTVGLGVEIPLWRLGNGRVEARRGEAQRSRQARLATARSLQGDRAASYARLTGLLARIAGHEDEVLAPARSVLRQTREGYRSGDLGLTELIDAAETVRRAEQDRRELLLQAQLQAAELRRARGERLSNGAEQDE